MDTLSKDILTQIQKRGITPRPFWYFLVRRSVFWVLAILSVLVGAVALSVAHYVFFDNGGVSPSVLIESPLEGVFQGAPLVWLVLFGLLVASAYLSLRNTRTGYRYQAVSTLAIVTFVTIALAGVLISLDFGHAIYYYLTHSTSFYQAVVESSDDL